MHLDVIKGDKVMQKLMIDEKKFYIFGRNATMCDFVVEHDSCSRAHAALVYHKDMDRFFLVDLKSSTFFVFCLLYKFNFTGHGTFIGKIRLEPEKPEHLPMDSTFHFGASSRR
jgi:nuclear inhibitor of protein phosphatase 1